MSWGFLGFSGPLIGQGSDQRRVGILQEVEKAEGAGGSPGGVVRVCADDVEYEWGTKDGNGRVDASG